MRCTATGRSAGSAVGHGAASSPTRTVMPSRASCRSRATSGRPGTVTGAVRHEDPGRGDGDVAPGRPPRERTALGRAWSAGSRRTRTARPAGRSRPARARPGRRRPAPARRDGGAPPPRCRGTRNRMVAAGDVDVLQRRGVPLGVVALQQRLRRPAAQDEGDLPGGVLGVQHAGVQAAGAERGRRGGRRRRPPAPGRPACGRPPGSGTGRPTSTRSRSRARR